MKSILLKINLKIVAYACIVVAIILTVWFFLWGNFIEIGIIPDTTKIKEIQPFISGIIVPLITLGTSLLIIETFRNTLLQNVSNNFFKLIDLNKKILDSVNCDISELYPNGIRSKGK